MEEENDEEEEEEEDQVVVMTMIYVKGLVYTFCTSIFEGFDEGEVEI